MLVFADRHRWQWLRRALIMTLIDMALLELGEDRPFVSLRLTTDRFQEARLWLLGRLLPAETTGVWGTLRLIGRRLEAFVSDKARDARAWGRWLVEREGLQRRT